MAFEKELLGLYVSGHPLEDIKDRLDILCTHTLGELEDNRADGELTLGGRIEEVKPIQTQSGKMMAFLTLEDLTGQQEMVIFPGEYERNHELLETDAMIFVRARFETKNKRTSLVVQRIFEIADLDQSFELHLQVTATALDDGTLSNIKDSLNAFQGNSRVYFHVANGSSVEKIQVGPQWNVELSQTLCDELKSKLGESHVKIYSNGEQIG